MTRPSASRRRTAASPAPRGYSKPTASARILDAVLTLCAVGGAVCILLVILALVFHISLILFRTGSMDPTIPQGSLAVVREIPATQAKVGDVVTVDREGKLPVTHRIVALEEMPGDSRRITLKGDANAAEDPAPYTVTRVRIVLFSVPGLARPVAALNSPLVMGSVTITVAALVVWALWPRRTGTEDDTGDTGDPL